MKPREIVPGVHYVGAPDFDRRLFDALIPLPDGTSYNAYLVQGRDKTALIDAVEPEKLDVLRPTSRTSPGSTMSSPTTPNRTTRAACPGSSSGIPMARLLASEPAKPLLVDHLGLDPAQIRTVADGERLDLGGQTLRFIYTPWVHWPETMSTYLEEDRILFSCDWFGAHLAQTGPLRPTAPIASWPRPSAITPRS